MNYLECNAQELCLKYVMNASNIVPKIFALPSFSAADLKSEGFDMIGDCDDFHLYEKSFLAIHFKRSVDVTLKRYFFNEKESGCGISLSPGVRLAPLLKRLFLQDVSLECYFFENMLDGALVLDCCSVMRFSINRAGTAYEVRELESGQGSYSEGAAVSSIRRSMSPLSKMVEDGRGKVAVFHRLVNYFESRQTLR
ncbi:hypothetical protein C4Q28_09270 [Pseudomonas sp. SWI6]|uniref:hypothetical protein n=1 Tax=Pseudomonas sp. SWI6 TaxID=2083051 RepID=UPI000CE5EE4A|nr:hypothetical protein [Pseudomonas sp. SWI6]AVD82343.1 hypothetical protein C4Q28_09270 [Pseudomonas sp. SWI6]